MPVILFDMDSKLAASRLSQELLFRLVSVQEEQRRLEYYKAAVNRCTDRQISFTCPSCCVSFTRIRIVGMGGKSES